MSHHGWAGGMYVPVPAPGTYTACMTASPKGFQFPSAPCRSVTVASWAHRGLASFGFEPVPVVVFPKIPP